MCEDGSGRCRKGASSKVEEAWLAVPLGPGLKEPATQSKITNFCKRTEMNYVQISMCASC